LALFLEVAGGVAPLCALTDATAAFGPAAGVLTRVPARG